MLMKQYSITKAKDKLTSLVHAVEKNIAIELTRRGKPVAVLLSIQEYQRLQAPKTGFWDALSQMQAQINFSELSIEPELFTGSRDRSSGREVNF